MLGEKTLAQFANSLNGILALRKVNLAFLLFKQSLDAIYSARARFCFQTQVKFIRDGYCSTHKDYRILFAVL